MGDPGDDNPFPTQHDLGAKDPFEGSEHAPATRNLEPNTVRIRPEGHRTGKDSLPEPTFPDVA